MHKSNLTKCNFAHRWSNSNKTNSGGHDLIIWNFAQDIFVQSPNIPVKILGIFQKSWLALAKQRIIFLEGLDSYED